MKRAIAVIGSAFGDEGKGLMVDYFCRQAQERPIVVRYNGGAQAGHTVVTPEGKRHVFHHFGAGTFAGADTYLSKYSLVNPSAWADEGPELAKKFEIYPKLFIHPEARVSTIYDMFLNQKIEEARKDRHGSCGMGVHETMLRHDSLPFTAKELSSRLLLESIRDYTLERLKFLGLDTVKNIRWVMHESILWVFTNQCNNLRDLSIIRDLSADKSYENSLCNREVIFEGAQGLLLDQDNKRFFPHVTHSKTGLHNVIEICKKAGITHLDACYVARSYLTRHGVGELPGEDPNLSYEDNTNQPNPWQGTLRFAPQDWRLIDDAIHDDYNANYGKGVELNASIAITHVDQCAQVTPDFYGVKINVKYESMGPTYKDVYVRKSISEETLLESHSRWGSELSQSCSSLP